MGVSKADTKIRNLQKGKERDELRACFRRLQETDSYNGYKDGDDERKKLIS